MTDDAGSSNPDLSNNWFDRRPEYRHEVDWWLDYFADVNATILPDAFRSVEESVEESEGMALEWPTVNFRPLAGVPLLGRWEVDVTEYLRQALLFGAFLERKYPAPSDDFPDDANALAEAGLDLLADSSTRTPDFGSASAALTDEGQAFVDRLDGEIDPESVEVGLYDGEIDDDEGFIDFDDPDFKVDGGIDGQFADLLRWQMDAHDQAFYDEIRARFEAIDSEFNASASSRAFVKAVAALGRTIDGLDEAEKEPADLGEWVPVLALGAQLLGDFPLQSDRMASGKFDSRPMRAAHVAIQTALAVPTVLAAGWGRRRSVAYLATLAATHYAVDSRRWVDPEKFEDGFESAPIWFDQSLHIAALGVAAVVATRFEEAEQ